MKPAGRHFRFSPWPVLLTLGAVGLAIGVFVVTQGVQQREMRVNELNRQLLSEQQTLRVLDAEWAYLTRPQRLENLMAMKVAQGEMPPAPIPIATPMQETAQAVVEQEKPPVAAAGATTAAPKPEQPEAQAVKAVPARLAAVEDRASKKKSAVARAPKKAKVKQVSARVKNKMDEAWRITPKAGRMAASLATASAAHSPQIVSSYRRGGIARPIVE